MRSTSRPLFVVAAAGLTLFGCRGKMLATAHLSGPGTAEAKFTPGSKPPKLWADFDGEWTGSNSRYSRPPLKFDVDVLQGGKSLGTVACTTEGDSGTRVCSTETSMGSDHTGNCEFSMACSLPSLGSGEVTLKVKGHVSDPSRIKRVSNMSLNVRED